MPTLSIIVPVYNEEGAIKDTIESLSQLREEIIRSSDVSAVEIILVNDGSTDDGAKIISKYSQVKLISHPTRTGYGAALKTGFANATGDLIGFIDADRTYAPHSFIELYNSYTQQNADMVVGSRIIGDKRKGFTFIRYAGNLIFAFLAKLTTGTLVTDSTSGMRLFNSELVTDFYYLPDGLDFALAMTMKGLNNDMKIVEVEIPYGERVGKSKLNAATDGMRFLRTTFFFTLLGKPFRVLFITGCIFMALALLLACSPLVGYFHAGTVPSFFLYRLMSVLVIFLVGLNLILIGYFSQKLIRKPKIRRFFLANLLGGSLIAGGFLLNIDGLYQFITTGHVTSSWVRPITGAVFILSGFQVCSFSILFRILSSIDKHNRIRMERYKNNAS